MMPASNPYRIKCLLWIGLGVALAALMCLLVLFPQIDLAVSGLFYVPGVGFPARGSLAVEMLNLVATRGALVLAVCLTVAALATRLLQRSWCGLDSKAGLFLLVCLLVGPGLIANLVFKDHWGRARPRDVTAFGGTASFGPALLPQRACDTNCSFVAGDAAFGYALTALAYCVAALCRRRVFWNMMALGSVFAAARLVSGAHFFSDILFAAFFMLATLAGLHAVFYGKRETLACWRDWLGLRKEDGA